MSRNGKIGALLIASFLALLLLFILLVGIKASTSQTVGMVDEGIVSVNFTTYEKPRRSVVEAEYLPDLEGFSKIYVPDIVQSYRVVPTFSFDGVYSILSSPMPHSFQVDELTKSVRDGMSEQGWRLVERGIFHDENEGESVRHFVGAAEFEVKTLTLEFVNSQYDYIAYRFLEPIGLAKQGPCLFISRIPRKYLVAYTCGNAKSVSILSSLNCSDAVELSPAERQAIQDVLIPQAYMHPEWIESARTTQ